MTKQERRQALRDSALLVGLFILGGIVENLDGWPLTIAGWLAVTVIIIGYIAYKRSAK